MNYIISQIHQDQNELKTISPCDNSTAQELRDQDLEAIASGKGRSNNGIAGRFLDEISIHLNPI